MASKLKKLFNKPPSVSTARVNAADGRTPQADQPGSSNTMQTTEATYDLSQAPRFLIIGAGHRGTSYARAIKSSTNGVVAAVADLNTYKRDSFGDRYKIPSDLRFSDWRELLKDESQAVIRDYGGIDGVLICTLDQTHADIATAVIPLGWHVLVEKPLATTYEDCLKIQAAVEKANCIFAIGHVLRYSPHNRLLHRLLTEDKIVGEIVAIEHKEPVGWYHFSHSFVRGNWHREADCGPSILTKCCHDLDILLWLLCSPKPLDPSDPSTEPHLPSSVYSIGHLTHFRPSNKPKHASNNCITCPTSVERTCMYSAKKIYIENPSGMRGGYNTEWPVNIVYPEVEDDPGNFESKENELLKRLAEGPYGRCVYDGHNDVVDNQIVVMSWDGEVNVSEEAGATHNQEGGAHETRGPKTATITMTAFSHAICERKTIVYGTKGELHSDTSWPAASSDQKKRPMRQPQTSLHSILFTDPYAEWVSHIPGPVDLSSGHGGGDTGLAQAFVRAVEAVKVFGWDVGKAQREHVGAGIDEAVRAHGMAWCAEESRVLGVRKDWSVWDNEQRKSENL
ncbi:hypothetical protein H072_781 [Dactylellina haptotyla CBS 200.50]|uniref:Gfo/Idh/MocA-like oxidoreductase N-terminal domain-containing protein n=1 Tax=Dactylellina haptotyla (strain CBS 200.50) TaxID=1284197 RepID=S8CBW0_DACHA|nr:hypothetical protein H072_781 [Dactylellina haptotyla CBS 200.50]